MIAALYVLDRGPYFGLPDVDPHPVVAHPPCERWGRYAAGGPSHHGRFTPGDDGGCLMSRRQRCVTPPAFRDLLIGMARSAGST